MLFHDSGKHFKLLSVVIFLFGRIHFYTCRLKPFLFSAKIIQIIEKSHSIKKKSVKTLKDLVVSLKCRNFARGNKTNSKKLITK